MQLNEKYKETFDIRLSLETSKFSLYFTSQLAKLE
jgi:hypothetical protein